MKKLSVILALAVTINSGSAKNVDNNKIDIIKQLYTHSLIADEFIKKYGDKNLTTLMVHQNYYLKWLKFLDENLSSECGRTPILLEDDLALKVVEPAYDYKLLNKNTVKVSMYGIVNHQTAFISSATYQFKRIGSHDKITNITFSNGRNYIQNVKEYCHR